MSQVQGSSLPASTPAPTTAPGSIHIGGMRIDAGTYASSTALITRWAAEPDGQARSRYVAIANVHLTMEAHDSDEYRALINQSALVTSDGMPLVWVLRRRGHHAAERVYGPTLMLHVCEAAATQGLPVALFGGSPDVLAQLTRTLLARFPKLSIACAISPPFGPISPELDADYCEQLKRSGARILFVGLGCPKQERWMAAHQGRIPAVMLGVGAAFNFHAGHVRQAPAWMQRLGLEWAFRLAMEPRRLWRRYLWHNPRFIALVLREHFSRTRSTQP